MPWIRLDTGMKRDPRIWKMAELLRKDVGAIVGYVANVLAEFPEHARDGDLTNVPDVLLEEWALWHGRKGAFAQAFVAELCDDRKVRAWEKHNGNALRQRDETHKRVRAYRERNAHGAVSGNATCNALLEPASNALQNGGGNVFTERNGTERNGKTRASAPAGAASDPEFDRFWAGYPARAGGNPRATALSAWQARRREGVPAEAMLAGEARYALFLTATDRLGTTFVQQAATFLSKAKRSWEEPWTVDRVSSTQGTAATLWARYKASNLLTKWERPEYERIGGELVTQGHYSDVETFLDELRLTKPWTLADARTDAWAVNEIASRLSAAGVVSGVAP